MNYKDVKCPVCEKEFQRDDDIVVCPECGMPHHRSCYKELGHCATESWHAEGKVWENPNERIIKVTRPKPVVCPNCGMPNPEESTICENCQAPLDPNAPPPSQTPPVQTQNQTSGYNSLYGFPGQNEFTTIKETDLIGNIPARDFIYYIRHNPFYFLRIFKLMCQRAKSKVFNWAAFFFNFFYFFYRKMYRIGTVLLVVMVLINIPSIVLSYHILEQWYADPLLFQRFAFDVTGYEGLVLLSDLFVYLRFGISVFCGFIANRQYYLQAVRHIEIARQQNIDHKSQEYYYKLMEKGGTSIKAVVLLVLGWTAGIFLISWFFMTSMLS